MTNLSTLRALLTSAHTAEALTQLAAWAQTQSPVWRQAAQLLQASWANNEQQANRGLIAYDEAERVRNRITHGALSLLDEIESGASAPKAVLDGLQKQFLTEPVAAVLQGGNVTDLGGSNIHVQGSRDVVIGSGNIITKKTGLGRRQFWGIGAGLIVLLLGGYFAFGLLRERQEETYVSLQAILAELKVRSAEDVAVRTRVENSRTDLERWLSAGMTALQRKQYPIAVENLEKVAAEAPLATVRQNLAFAYEQMGQTNKAKENLAQAKQIREAKPQTASEAASTPEQPTVTPEVAKPAPKTDMERAASVPSGARINLLAPENGGKYVSGSDTRLEKLIDGKEKGFFYKDNDELTVAFSGERPATFDQFELLVGGTSNHNIAEFELSAGNVLESEFKIIGKFKPEDKLLNQTPYQKFTFPPVTARYFKFKILKSVGGFTWYPNAGEIRLMGKL